MQINNLKKTCTGYPSRWEFTTDNNRPAYIRYSEGYLSVRIGIEVFGKQMGNSLDGFISWENIEKLIENIDIKEYD